MTSKREPCSRDDAHTVDELDTQTVTGTDGNDVVSGSGMVDPRDLTATAPTPADVLKRAGAVVLVALALVLSDNTRRRTARWSS